ncbi:MAG: deoxyguanosinetriphosphate triphosphohydrolase family protein [Candidatus Brocadiales bacterium]
MADPFFEKIRLKNAEKERRVLSKYATKSLDGLRRRLEKEDDLRGAFSRDTDRILHSRTYTRYIDKTQVFYLVPHDHITHRVLHVQLVSKISRVIGHTLELNEDLIEAIALGHDLGHCAYGHDGEDCLTALCEEHGIDRFVHSVQGVRFLDRIEWEGRGMNLTLQVLDGILCHDGESELLSLTPHRGKTWEDHDRELCEKMRKGKYARLLPMTLEGCVVRLADSISYLGRDIEDAITIKLVKREDLPGDCVDALGIDPNKIVATLVNTLVRDLVKNSLDRDCIAFSKPVSEAFEKLKAFNYKNIYENPKIKTQSKKIENIFRFMFKAFVKHVEEGRKDSRIFKDFLCNMNDDYMRNTQPAEKVRDFIAGMTDDYFINCFEGLPSKPKGLTRPEPFGYTIP